MVAGHDCLVLEDARPLAFCGGLIRPRVFLSRNLISELGQQRTLLPSLLMRPIIRTGAIPCATRLPASWHTGSSSCQCFESSVRSVERSEIAADQAAVAGGESERKALARPSSRSMDAKSEGVAVSLSSDRIGVLAGEKPSWIPQ